MVATFVAQCRREGLYLPHVTLAGLFRSACVDSPAREAGLCFDIPMCRLPGLKVRCFPPPIAPLPHPLPHPPRHHRQLLPRFTLSSRARGSQLSLVRPPGALPPTPAPPAHPPACHPSPWPRPVVWRLTGAWPHWRRQLIKRNASKERSRGGLTQRSKAPARSSRVFSSCEAAWQEHIGGAEKKWRELKAAFPEAVARDLATHLGVQWPLPEGGNELAALVKELWDLLRAPGMLTNVYEQSHVQADAGELRRIPEGFVLGIAFGVESLSLQRVLKPVDKALRRASGLAVGGDAPMAPAEGAPPPRRRLMYTDHSEKEARNGKGKGQKGHGAKGDGAKGAGERRGGGKAHGKMGKGGKGRKGKGAAADGAEPGVAA